MLESCLSLASASNDKYGTERKQESKNSTSSGKEKLAAFAFKENNKNVCDTDAGKTCSEEKVEVGNKEYGTNGQEHKEEKEMETNGREEKTMETNGKEENQMEANGIKEEVEEKMDTEESVPSLPQKKPAKGGRIVAFII